MPPPTPPRFLSPLLVAANFEETVTFYRSALGLAVNGTMPYAECRTPSALLAIIDGRFLSRTGEFDTPTAHGMVAASPTLLTFEVEDLEGLFERLVASGVRFMTPPSARLPLGRRYAVLRDPDGRTIVLMGPRTAPA